MSPTDQDPPSTRPYLIRALHEWCVVNGFSPYIAVHVDAAVQVPMEYVKDGEIVLNLSVDATSAMRLGNEFVEFKARFGGVARDIIVPVSHVVAIYARENGQGMAFPAPAPPVLNEVPAEVDSRGGLHAVPGEASTAEGEKPSNPTPGEAPKAGKRSHLKRVK